MNMEPADGSLIVHAYLHFTCIMIMQSFYPAFRYMQMCIYFKEFLYLYFSKCWATEEYKEFFLIWALS